MVIDPILPLSISIAEGKGTYALFLGSGISSQAGIPTGTQLLDSTKKKLYMMDKSVDKIDVNEDFLRWLKENKLENMEYSELLGMFPSEEDRRNFLQRFFHSVEPTESHKKIANMVERGLVKVIITTNFDRLMERALDQKQVDYDVVDREHDLDVLKPREHSNCRIIKLHGDYKHLNIKNTEKELAKLEPKIESEFQTILNNYGIVMVGYSGSDRGVMSCLNERNSKYTLYWLKKDVLSDNVEELIKKQDGRVIEINSSDNFFTELLNKIDFYSRYENGETPEYVLHLIKEFLRTNDEVYFRETLKKQIKILENKWIDIYTRLEKEIQQNNVELVIDGLKDFEKYMDIFTAIGLVLIEYSHEFIEYYFKMFQKIYDLSTIMYENKDEHPIYCELLDIPKRAICNLYYILGAFCLKEENLAPLSTLFRMELLVNIYAKIELNYIWDSDILYSDTHNRRHYKIFNFLKESYDYKTFLKEFFRSETEFFTYILQFNMVLCLYISKMIIESQSNEYGLDPAFASYRKLKEKILIPLLKCKSHPLYLEEMAKTFNEEKEKFKSEYIERSKRINEVIDRNRHSGRFEIPSNIFSD